jgi:hypothetical protein
MVNWKTVFTDLFTMINKKDEPSYFSGPRFIEKVQKEVDPNFPDYGDYIEKRRGSMESTTREHYFWDILLGFDEPSRLKLVESILREVGASDPELRHQIRATLAGGAIGPSADVPKSYLNAARLNLWLSRIDEAIDERKPERAVTLAYSCLEGFFRAFMREKQPKTDHPKEIVSLSKEVREFVKNSEKECPGEVLNLITQIAHAVNKGRDGFSESHFGKDAGLWLALFLRDLVNTQIRMLAHFL